MICQFAVVGQFRGGMENLNALGFYNITFIKTEQGTLKPRYFVVLSVEKIIHIIPTLQNQLKIDLQNGKAKKRNSFQPSKLDKPLNGHFLQEGLIVRNGNQRPLEFVNGCRKDLYVLNIQVIGRLIQDYYIGRSFKKGKAAKH